MGGTETIFVKVATGATGPQQVLSNLVGTFGMTEGGVETQGIMTTFTLNAPDADTAQDFSARVEQQYGLTVVNG